VSLAVPSDGRLTVRASSPLFRGQVLTGAATVGSGGVATVTLTSAPSRLSAMGTS
jgi:hypothetical protein